MWKKVLLIIALHFCAEISANSIYRGNNEWHQPANNFDQVIKDFNSYHQKLQNQGYVPFYLHNNANHLGQTFGPQQVYHHQPVYHHQEPEYQYKPEIQQVLQYHQKPEVHHKTPEYYQKPEVDQQVPEYHQKPEVQQVPEYHHKPEHHEHHHEHKHTTTTTTTTQKPTTTTHKPTHPTKGNFHTLDHKPIPAAVESILPPLPFKKPELETIKDHFPLFHAPTKAETLEKVQEKVDQAHDKADSKLATIKQTFDNQINAISQFNEDVFNKITAQTSKVFDSINNKVEKITTVKPPTPSLKEKVQEAHQVAAQAIFDKKEQTLEKVQDKVDKAQDKAESNLAALKQTFDKQVSAVSQFNENFYNRVVAHTSKVFDTINNKLEKIEADLQKLRPGAPKTIEDEEEQIAEVKVIDDELDEMRSLIDDVQESQDEMRLGGEMKTKVVDALQKASDKFNQMIEERVAKVNNKINEINEKVENLFGKLQTAVKRVKPTKKVYTPPTYKPTVPSIIDWKPKATTWQPEIYKYTIKDDFRTENVTEGKVEVTTEALDVTTVDDVEEETFSPDELALAEELSRSELEGSDDNIEDVEEFDEEEEEGGLPESEIAEIPLNDEDSEASTQASNNFRFDELEVIQLIPVIIDQLRYGRVTANEMSALEKIFGNLWPLMVKESRRDINGLEKMDSLLQTILNSEEVRLAKRDIQAQIGNDIYKNSLRRVYRGDSNAKSPKPYISLDDDRKLLSPSERLLNMVAAIVHKSNVAEKAQAKKARNMRRKKQQKRPKKNRNPFGIVTIEKPKQRYVDRILSINRMKRSLIKFESDLADMKALLEHVNNDNELDESEEVAASNQDSADDYMDDDDEDIDYDYQNLSTPESFYDNWYASRRFYDDYEDGSVNEFINLARQRDRREKNTAEFEEDDEFNEDEYDYDVYDEN